MSIVTSILQVSSSKPRDRDDWQVHEELQAVGPGSLDVLPDHTFQEGQEPPTWAGEAAFQVLNYQPLGSGATGSADSDAI